MDDRQHLQDLQARAANGERFKYCFFWGHTVNDPVTATCFSQWYPIGFELDGIRYATPEHYMMAQKATLFADESTRELILLARTPAQAKKLGREVRGFDDAAWKAARFDIVVRGNRAKFAQNAELKQYLLQTGERVIVEASPVDSIWGIGMARDEPGADNPAAWKGLNLLGFALMQVRAELIDVTA
jgi:ribA/ribD-fused uncharacterized protein